MIVEDSVPQAEQVTCHHGDAQTNKATKRDSRVGRLISQLHNADKASVVWMIQLVKVGQIT